MLPEIDESKPVVPNRADGEKDVAKTVEDSSDTITRLRKEALNKKESSGAGNIDEIDSMNVHQLRHLARSIPEFPIKGREISRANRDLLLKYFRNLK